MLSILIIAGRGQRFEKVDFFATDEPPLELGRERSRRGRGGGTAMEEERKIKRI